MIHAGRWQQARALLAEVHERLGDCELLRRLERAAASYAGGAVPRSPPRGAVPARHPARAGPRVQSELPAALP